MKNTFKKGLSLVLACMLVMSMSAIAVLADGNAVSISMGYVTGELGQQVVVPITISENSNVASGAFAIDFDSTQLTFVEKTEGTVDLSFCEVGVTEDNPNQIGVAFIGDANGSAIDAAGGVLFNLVFTVNASATEPVTELAFNFEPVRETDDPGLFDVDNTKLTYQATSGSVVTGAQADVMIDLGEVSGAAGSTVSVPVTINADTSVVSGAFTVAYDASKLAFVDYTAGTIAAVTQVEVDAVEDGADEVGVIFSTQNVDTAITEAGTIVYINFEILEGAEGSAALTINLVHPTDETVSGGVATAAGDVEGAVFLGGAVEITEEVPEPTTTTVTFNVTPADATVEFNGETKAAVDGVATFENVEFGALTYTVSKEGYVSQTAEVTVAADMAAITVTLAEEVVTPPAGDAPVPELKAVRAFDVQYDAETQTITVLSGDEYSDITSAGVEIKFGDAAAKDITVSSSTIKKYTYNFIAQKSAGKEHTGTITYGEYQYTLNINFVDDPNCVNFTDILTLRAQKFDYVNVATHEKKIVIQVDSADIYMNWLASNLGFALVPETGATATYEYDAVQSGHAYSTTHGFQTTATTSKYTSWATGVNTETAGGGAYGNQKLYFILRGKVPTTYIYVTLTKGDYSTTYEVQLNARNFEEEGDVDITDVLPLRADRDSFVIDNDAKTIYFESTAGAPTAGFAVDVDNSYEVYRERPRRVLTGESGYSLASAPISEEATQNMFDRYVLARRSMADENGEFTYKVKVFGGEKGITYTIFTVTVQFK